MNKRRLKTIRDATVGLQNIIQTLESVKDDEQDAYDNMLEHLRTDEMGERAENALDLLDEAISTLQNVADSLEDIE